MLIRVTLENWMSFRDPVTFSMIASRERKHRERLPKLEKYKTTVLPIAALYGGNASGKTNFFKALNFAKKLVVDGTQPDSPILVEPFRLDAKSLGKPTRFTFEILADETIYEFSFAVTRECVLEEKLVQVNSASERVLYERMEGKPNFDSTLEKDLFLSFAFKGTRDNQLFLTNAISQKVDMFRPVYDWFKDTFELIAPDTRFGIFDQFLNEDHPQYEIMNDMLSQLDTGIAHLGGEEIPIGDIPVPEIRSNIQKSVKEGTAVSLLNTSTGERIVITRKRGELCAKKLVTYHPTENGEEVVFDIRQESDGSRRVIDLLPAFLDVLAVGSNKVFIIDEIDRSLHTLLTRSLLESYLTNCGPASRAQLLLTTHDVLLMDQQLFRRDEMWVTERNSLGVSSMMSFSEYKDVRYDKNLRKSYLQGRLGGIPNILLSVGLKEPDAPRNSEGNG